MTNVETGERVEVRPLGESLATLDANPRRRGRSFEPGTERHCGHTRRLLAPSERILDERSVRMIPLADARAAPQGGTCRGLYDWREAGLQRRAAREREAA